MSYEILAINPGSTSTKIAVYEDKNEKFSVNIDHPAKELDVFEGINDQFPFRKEAILQVLKENHYSVERLAAVVGRGGQLPPVKSGGYLVNQTMKRRIIEGPIVSHASNLGALLADAIAVPLGIPAYIYDAVSSDELKPVARVIGIPEIKRQSFCHVLNSKAMCRKAAEAQGKRYEEMNFIVAHLGGGISVSAHEKGKIVDVITDDGGPFSPERSGSIPLIYIVDMCYSGLYNKREIMKKLRGMGGLKALLGTPDCREIEKMIDGGDENAKLIYEAQAYQIAKGIGELAPVFESMPDAVILTGGVAYSQRLTAMIQKRVEFIAPVIILPGENELESLAYGALRILQGEEKAHVYREPKKPKKKY